MSVMSKHDFWHLSLTYDLDLQSQPSQGQPTYQISRSNSLGGTLQSALSPRFVIDNYDRSLVRGWLYNIIDDRGSDYSLPQSTAKIMLQSTQLFLQFSSVWLLQSTAKIVLQSTELAGRVSDNLQSTQLLLQFSSFKFWLLHSIDFEECPILKNHRMPRV